MRRPILLIAAGPGWHTPALQRAFDLARGAELPVHVGLFVRDALIDRSNARAAPEVRARAQVLAGHQAWVDELTARWRRDGLEASGAAVWAPVAHEAILARVAELEPALIVKDVGHEPLVRRITYTALDWKLLRRAPAPLMLVGGHSNHLPRCILAAVDTLPGTADAEALNALILREALKLADWSDAEVHVGHVFPQLPVAAAADSQVAFQRLYAETREADRQAFMAFAAAHQVPAEARHWREGDPVQRLGELVRERGVDLLVLGSSHHSALDRLLVGSTAEAMLYQAPCDVLLVKPEAFAARLARSRRAA